MIPRFALGFLAGLATLLMVEELEELDAEHQDDTPARKPATPTTGTEPAFRDIVGAITHDMRAPVAVILGYLELVADGVIGTRATGGIDVADRIRHAALQLTELADDLDTLGSAPPAHGTAAICDLADAVRTALRNSTREAESRWIALDLDDSPAVPVRAGPDDLEKALGCLFTVAIRTGSSRRVRVRIVREAGFGCVVLRGISIDPATAAAALDPTRPRAVNGVGLRLLIARRAAERFDGEITAVEDELRLRLPSASSD